MQKVGTLPDSIEFLPRSGSDRLYARMRFENISLIGAWNPSLEENAAFISFSDHFHAKGIRVPKVLAVSDDKLCYLVQDLGNTSLLDIVKQKNTSDEVSDEVIRLYRESLSQLAKMQVAGHEGLNYQLCWNGDRFDAAHMRMDLNYFKFYFLKLASQAGTNSWHISFCHFCQKKNSGK